MVICVVVDNFVGRVQCNDLVATDFRDIGFVGRICDRVKAGHFTVVSIAERVLEGGYVRAIFHRASVL